MVQTHTPPQGQFKLNWDAAFDKNNYKLELVLSFEMVLKKLLAPIEQLGIFLPTLTQYKPIWSIAYLSFSAKR